MLDTAITAWTEQHDLEFVLSALAAAEVPSGKIYTAADIHADPHYRAREMIETHALPDGSRVDFPGVFPKLSGTPGKTRWLGPELGAHTQDVLASIGIEEAKFQDLRARGVV